MPPICEGNPPMRGFFLIEALTALALLGIGLLPLCTLAPVALGTLRHYEALSHATRAGAELAELEAPSLVLSSVHTRGIATEHLRLCKSLASAGDQHILPACVAGQQLAVVGPLHAFADAASGNSNNARLRTIALWVRP